MRLIFSIVQTVKYPISMWNVTTELQQDRARKKVKEKWDLNGIKYREHDLMELPAKHRITG